MTRLLETPLWPTEEEAGAEPERCDALSWFPIHDLPVNTIPYVRRAIDNHLKGVFFDSFGWR